MPTYHTHCRDCGKSLIVPSWITCEKCARYVAVKHRKINKRETQLEELGINVVDDVCHSGKLFTLEVIQSLCKNNVKTVRTQEKTHSKPTSQEVKS